MQTLNLSAKGLHTHANPLKVPEGSLLVGRNIVTDKEDTHELRRGFKLYGSALSTTGDKLFNYQNRLMLSYASKLAYDSDNAGTFVDLTGTYSPPTGANRIRSMEASKNFYFTTSAGVKKMDAYNSTPTDSGMPKGLDGSGALNVTPTWFANNNQVAYRIVWGKTDANNNKILGAPGSRIIVTNNAGAARGVDLTFTMPASITTSHFYQIYRSGQSGGVSTEPNDELQLIVEKNPTAGEVTAKSVTYTDQTPDNLRGATIYTAASQQGILQANDSPPLARDVALYKNSAFYANTVSKHRLNLTLISVGGTGFVIADTITIAGVTYTGRAAENAAAGEFLVYTAGTASANIDTTARSLVKVINTYASNTLVYAYYLTGYADLPGQILIEERGIGGSAFVAISSRGAAFSPTIPSSGSSYTSTNDTGPNVIYVSKDGQPEAVPILNKLYAGSAQYNIVRIIALRDAVFVLKEDGIYRITGESIADFRVQLFDSTTIIKCQESACAFNNQVWCFSTQGVVAISQSGSQIMSHQIEQTLLTISSSQYTNFDTASWAVPYESDRKYIFSTVSATSDTYAVQQFVYNSITNTWTNWILSMSSGIVSSRDNKLYLVSANSTFKYVYQERKSYDITDYAEKEIALTVSSSVGTTVTVSSTTGISAGWSLVQFNGTTPIRNSVITEITDATHLKVTDVISWAASAAVAYEPISAAISWAPIHGGNPSIIKHFQDQVTIFNNANFNKLTFSYTSDLSVANESVDVVPKSGGAWGLFPWGTVVWGGNNYNLQPIRTYVPREKGMCHWLNLSATHNQALTAFSIVGLAFFFETIDSRMK